MTTNPFIGRDVDEVRLRRDPFAEGVDRAPAHLATARLSQPDRAAIPAGTTRIVRPSQEPVGRMRLGLTVGGAVLAWQGLSTIGWAQEKKNSAADASWFEIIFLTGGPINISIMFLLVLLSITAVYLIIDHVLALRVEPLIPDGLAKKVQNLLSAGKLAEAHEVCRSSPSLLGFLLLHGITESDGGWSSVEKAVEDAAADQSARLMRKLEYLSVISNIAPMLGLLGTVVGMVLAFREVAISSGSAGAADLAEGIYSALITTIGGLLVAIPSLAAFAVFRNRVDWLITEAAYAALNACRPLKRTPPQAPPKV